MKIGVIADTHGDTLALRRALGSLKDAEAWIHLGDVVSDAALLRKQSGVAVYSVRGNCDFSASAELERIIELCGVRLFAVHGHSYHVDYDRSELSYRAQELGCIAALYGHTHISLIENDGRTLMINPGSPSKPRHGRMPSIAVLEISNGDISARIMTI
ncbi:MAG: metallophosphoesterase [Clostridia bacterium]